MRSSAFSESSGPGVSRVVIETPNQRGRADTRVGMIGARVLTSEPIRGRNS